MVARCHPYRNDMLTVNSSLCLLKHIVIARADLIETALEDILPIKKCSILWCDFTYHSTGCQYDAELLDNATQANSWLQVEIQ